MVLENPSLCFTCQSPEMEVWIKTLYLVYQQQLFLSSNDNDIAPINLNFLPKKKILDFFLYYYKRLAVNLKSNYGFWNSGARVFSLCLICFVLALNRFNCMSFLVNGVICMNQLYRLQNGNGRWCILMIMIGFKVRYYGDKT